MPCLFYFILAWTTLNSKKFYTKNTFDWILNPGHLVLEETVLPNCATTTDLCESYLASEESRSEDILTIDVD